MTRHHIIIRAPDSLYIRLLCLEFLGRWAMIGDPRLYTFSSTSSSSFASHLPSFVPHHPKLFLLSSSSIRTQLVGEKLKTELHDIEPLPPPHQLPYPITSTSHTHTSLPPSPPTRCGKNRIRASQSLFRLRPKCVSLHLTTTHQPSLSLYPPPPKKKRTSCSHTQKKEGPPDAK